MSTRHISDHDLAVIHEQVSGEYRRRNHEEGPIFMTVDIRAISALLSELIRRRGFKSTRASRLSPITKALMSLQVWESFDTEPMAQSSLATLKRSAKRHMNNPDAKWKSETTEEGLLRITRKPDGAVPEYRRAINPLVSEFAKMSINSIRIFDRPKSIRSVHNGIKIQARRMMENPEANWACTNLVNGQLRVVRTK